MVVKNPLPGEVAVVGAGISGLTCARTLARAGFPVRVFDKARGPGGRVSTRRTPSGAFDHGAQYFTVRDPEFALEVETWVNLGVASIWRGRIVSIPGPGKAIPVRGNTDRYVGVPGMSAIGRFLARDLHYRPQERVHSLHASAEGWTLRSASGESGPFPHVVLAMPPEQVLELAPDLSGKIGSVTMEPCFALMFTLRETSPLDFDGAFLEGPVLSWAARNRSKPRRSTEETWVAHAGPDWSYRRLDSDPETTQRELLTAVQKELMIDPSGVTFAQTHFWRFARPVESLPGQFVLSSDLGLSASGDWCGGPRIEGAFLSGLELGRELVRRMGDSPGKPEETHE